MLLYDLNTSRNIDLPYWSYKEFDLDTLSDDECRSEFRFLKNDIYHLAEILQIPNQVRCYNRIVADGIEALCIFLKRFAYPCRYADMQICRYADMLPRFARPVPQFCMISNEIMNFIYETQHHRLRSFDQLWLSPENLQNYADVIHAKGTPLSRAVASSIIGGGGLYSYIQALHN